MRLSPLMQVNWPILLVILGACSLPPSKVSFVALNKLCFNLRASWVHWSQLRCYALYSPTVGFDELGTCVMVQISNFILLKMEYIWVWKKTFEKYLLDLHVQSMVSIIIYCRAMFFWVAFFVLLKNYIYIFVFVNTEMFNLIVKN